MEPQQSPSKIISEIGKPDIRVTILLAVAAFHALLLLGLSSQKRRSGHPVLRSLLWGVSAAYFPLMTYVLSYLTSYIPSAGDQATGVLLLVILVQFLRAKTDMAAMAVAAVASPAAGNNDVNSLKIRPSAENFINTFWVAGLAIYHIVQLQKRQDTAAEDPLQVLLVSVTVLISPLWVVGGCRTVLRFAAFQRATGSFALGRNVELIDGYMLLLREEEEEEGGRSFESASSAVAAVPRLIVTGERSEDVVDSPLGFHVKRSSLQRQDHRSSSRSRLVTLDRVWSSEYSDDRLQPEHKDLCLSFALFKCLRRRFAGYQLAAEAGSRWAFRFVSGGLLGREDDHERVFRVIATELSFAGEFFHSPLPMASLGATAAALHFLLSLIILPALLFLALLLLVVYTDMVLVIDHNHHNSWYPLVLLALLLSLIDASIEISEMVASVRSNWTKIGMIGHFVRSRNHCARRFFACLLRCRAPEFWDDKIQQTQLLKPGLPFGVQQLWRPWACRRFRARARARRQLSLQQETPIKVPLVAKEAILKSLRASSGQLSDGAAAIRRRAFSGDNDTTWACRDGGGVVTATDAILVWHIATALFDMKCSSSTSTSTPGRDSESPSSSTPVAISKSSKVVACSMSRYCTYLVAEAPDLLPDKPAWTTRRYEAVKKAIEEALSSKSTGDVPEDSSPRLYQHMVDTFCGQNSHSDEVLIKGSTLGKQLMEEVERQRSQGGVGAPLGVLVGDGALPRTFRQCQGPHRGAAAWRRAHHAPVGAAAARRHHQQASGARFHCKHSAIDRRSRHRHWSTYLLVLFPHGHTTSPDIYLIPIFVHID